MKEILDRLDRIQDDISEIKDTVNKNTVDIVKNAADIAHHIKRSDLAEERMDQQDDRIKPLEKHASFVKGAIWALGVAGAILLGLNELGILQKLFS